MKLTVAGEALHILLIKIYLLRDVSMTGRIAVFFSLPFSRMSFIYFFLCQWSKDFFLKSPYFPIPKGEAVHVRCGCSWEAVALS